MTFKQWWEANKHQFIAEYPDVEHREIEFKAIAALAWFSAKAQCS